MKDYKKVIYFLDFPFWFGGSNKVLLSQACIMQQRGYQVKVVIPNDQKGMHTKEYDRICDEYSLESMTAYYTVAACMEEIDILAALNEYQVIAALLKEYRPDIIHSAQLNIAVELAARELMIPHLMNIYQVDRQAFNVNWMKIYPQYHSCDSILMASRWGEGLKIRSQCIRIAYGTKSKIVSKYDKEKEIRILSIGGLCERKNQLESIKLISISKNKGYPVKLIILGDDQNTYADNCKKYVEDNALQRNVEFKGFVSNVEEYFVNADLLLIASTVESYPGVIVEGMANRIPIISTPVAGVPELLRNEENGFLAEGYDAIDLYNAFSKYVEYRQSGKIFQVVENAYNTYLQQHSFEAVGSELEKYYQWIVNDYFKRNISYITAAQVRQKIDEFRRDQKVDAAQIDTNKIWLLYHIFCVIEQNSNKKVMIWGAGLWGRKIFEWIGMLKEQIEFIGFIDSFKQGEYLGFPIVDGKDLLLNACGTIIIAIWDEKSRLEIMNYLDNNGKERNRDYFLIFNGPIRL